jgi:DNA-binding SARP family transcriptional activator
MEALWPHLAADAAAANLRKATHHLRRALGTPDPVVVDGGLIALCPDWEVATDSEAFEAAAKDALGRGPTDCAAAAELYRGELLPEDRYADWAFEPRQRLRLRHLQLLKLAGNWTAVLEVDPADEEAHRNLMERAIEAGNRQAALRQFIRLRETLHADMGVGPDRRSIALYEKALEMEGSSPATTERVAGLLAWALVHWNRMELDDAQRCAQDARTLAIEAELGRELGEATTVLGMVAHAQGRWRELFQVEFAEALSDRPALAPFVFDAHLCLAELSLYGADSNQQIEPFARSLLTTASEAHSAHGQGLAWLMLGEAELFAGRLTDAAHDLARAVRLHRAAHATSALALTMIRAAETAVARGRCAQASRLLDKATAIAQSAPLADHLMVRAYTIRILAANTTDQASDTVDRVERALQVAPAICQPCSIGFHVTAAATRARGGNLAGAQHHLERAERIVGMWQGGPWQAAVWEARGILRLAEGDARRGTALLNEAASLFATSGRPLDAARCQGEAA